MRKITYVFIGFLPFTLFGQIDVDSIYLWDNDRGKSDQIYPSVASQEWGAFIAWQDARWGDFDIFRQDIDWEGNKAEPNSMVSEDAFNEHFQIWVDAEGNPATQAVYAWEDTIYRGPSHPSIVWARIGMQPSFIINEGKRPSISCRDDGFFVVSLTYCGNPMPQIGCIWFSEQGAEINRDIVRMEDSIVARVPLSYAAYCDSGFVVVYEDSSRDGTQRSIYLQYRNRDGEIFTEREKVSYRGMSDAYNEEQPAVAVNNNGAGVVVWQDLRYGQGDPDIYCATFQMLPSSGSIDIGSQITVDYTTAQSENPRVTVFPNNDYFMVWSESVNLLTNKDIVGRGWINGSLFQKITINADTLNQQNPDIGSRNSDRCYVAWQSEELFEVPIPVGVRHFNNLFCRQYLYTLDGMIAVGPGQIPLVEDNSGGKRAWYYDDENYDNPLTTDWDEDPVDEPDSIYADLEMAIFDQIDELNTNGQYRIMVFDTLPQEQNIAALNEQDALFIDLGYRTDDASAGVITLSEQNIILNYIHSRQPTMVEGNDFGMMYAGTQLYNYYGANCEGDGESYLSGNIDTLYGLSGTSFADETLKYDYQQWRDNYPDSLSAKPGFEMILGSCGAPPIDWIAGRCVGWGTYWKDGRARADSHTVYSSFMLSGIKSKTHPNTYAEFYRCLLGYLGLNCQPEPITTLSTDTVGVGEGCFFLNWQVVSDDNPTQSAEGNYKLKFSNQKMGSDMYFNLAKEYFQTWNTQGLPVGERVSAYLYGLPPMDTLVFALKVSDESNLWDALGAEPRVAIPGDSVTPHTITIGDNYVKDFTNRYENLDTRNADSLFVTWDKTNFYAGFSWCNFSTEGDLFIYLDTRSGGADSTIDWNGTGSNTKSNFMAGFRPDYVFIVENPGSSPYYYYQEWVARNSNRGSWSNAVFDGSFSEDDVINGYNYTEIRLPFTDMNYDTLAQFRLVVVVQDESTNEITNAFPINNPLGLAVFLTQYYQWGSGLRSGMVPIRGAGVIGAEEQEVQGAQNTVTCLMATPNPFSGKTKILLPAAAYDQSVEPSLKVYDITGRIVKKFQLHNSKFILHNSFTWDGTDDNGKALPGGIYFCEYIVTDKKETIKIIYIK